jgi:methylenetetrahydrofolate dehydrogenase (NADP+)/methenyltetrahydrofolate cyclohydrolase
VVLVGSDPASEVYVAAKGRKAEELGFNSVQHTLPATTGEAELLTLIAALNRDPAVHGILVQFPVPAQIDQTRVVEAISPAKDVDGLNPVNVGRLASGVAGAMIPCTPAGCLILIKRALPGGLSGRSAVVVGRSTLVGRPMAQLLLGESCTVTIAHSKTRDLAATVRGAEIVVAAVGRAEMIRGAWLRPGAVVIDVGTSRVPAPEKGAGKTRLVGDVAFAEAAEVAGAITPVPGGVGPMTIARLMANTLIAACRSVGRAAPALD